MTTVDLFVGAGGMALGVSRAGFRHHLVAEPLREGDVRALDYSGLGPGTVDLLAAGPPCQPFSLGGRHAGHRDRRDMFPEVARAIRELRPRAILVENVRGLVRPRFARYFAYVLLQLTYPELVRREGESWPAHLARLERHGAGHRNGNGGLCYRITHRVLNAADYGVPQWRDRVLIVGFRSDLACDWTFPAPTHSRDALIVDQWITGAYWDRHRIARRRRPEPTRAERARAGRLGDAMPGMLERPWRTVRDALVDLPPPVRRGEPPIPNHRFDIIAPSPDGLHVDDETVSILEEQLAVSADAIRALRSDPEWSRQADERLNEAVRTFSRSTGGTNATKGDTYPWS